MTPHKLPQLAPTVFITALFAVACATPKRVDEGPITMMRNGDRIEAPTRATDAATTQAVESQIAGRERRDSLNAVAFGNCAPTICEALGRGELALGMSEAQVLAATRSTGIAWTSRRSGAVTVLSPRDAEAGPRDAIAPVALVQLAAGAVSGITYREPEGWRTVTTAADANDPNRARALALVRDGDALAAAGDFAAALDRYDRASVVHGEDAVLQYKIASSLDKLLRPVEAELRYKMFLNQLVIQQIDAQGNANAKLADAIARARERIIVLEKK